MVDGFPDVDLFGDPFVARSGGRGRPEHVWTLENSNKVLLAFARGLSVKQAASIVGVSAPTLRKVYFSEVAKRNEAQLKMEMTQLVRLNAEASKGNVTAEKELFKQLDRLRQRDQAKAFASPTPQQPKKGKPKGKKEELAERAAQVTGIYEPPPPPSQLIN